MTAEQQNILEVTDFSVSYGYGDTAVRAVSDVNFTLGTSCLLYTSPSPRD